MSILKLGFSLFCLGLLLLVVGGLFLPQTQASPPQQPSSPVPLTNPNLRYMAIHSADAVVSDTSPISATKYPGIAQTANYGFGNIVQLAASLDPITMSEKLDIVRLHGLQATIDMFWVVATFPTPTITVHNCNEPIGAKLVDDWESRLNTFMDIISTSHSAIYGLYFDEPYCKFSTTDFLSVTTKIQQSLGQSSVRVMVIETPAALIRQDLSQVASAITTPTSAYYQNVDDLGFDYYFTKPSYRAMTKWRPTVDFTRTDTTAPNFEEGWGIYLQLFERLKTLAANNQRLWLVPELYIDPCREQLTLTNTQLITNSLPYALDKYYQLALQEPRVYGLYNFVYHAGNVPYSQFNYDNHEDSKGHQSEQTWCGQEFKEKRESFLGLETFITDTTKPFYYNQPLINKTQEVAKAIKNNAPLLLSRAPTATITASNYYQPVVTDTTYIPEHAIDGITSTVWNCGCPAPAWIRLDLGAEYDLTSIRINPIFSIISTSAQITIAGGPTTAMTATNQPLTTTLWANNFNDLAFNYQPITKIRYLQLGLSQIPTTTWVGLREIEVYGYPSLNPITNSLKLSQNAIVTATSMYTITYSTPQEAVDSNTASFWNSGGFAPREIQLDLRSPYNIGKIRLNPNVSISGTAVITIYGGTTPNPTTVITQLSGIQLADWQVITLTQLSNTAGVRYVRIKTDSISGPSGSSWVAWREVEVYGAP